jgi:GT2 family glycosyltransferase
MLRRSVWERIPFDEEINGVEDRDWAKKVIAAGYHIVYEPQASVYHHHGIHQTMDVARAERVVKMIELINGREPLFDD